MCPMLSARGYSCQQNSLGFHAAYSQLTETDI